MKKSNSQMDEFKTPSPSRRKIPQRSLFTDRCSRSMASQTQNRFQNDMDMLPSTPKFSSPIRSNKKSLCRTDPIPRKFRCEMPQSARKVEPQPLPPSEREFRPIIQSSFYGKKAKLSDSSSAGLISPTSNSTTKLEASDVVKRPVLKSLQVSVNTENKSDGKKKKHKLLQRNYASGSVMKSKKKKTNVFGSKGVSHAIKKPKKIIIPPKKKDIKVNPIKEKTFAQLFRESLEEEKKMRKRRKKKSVGYKSENDLSDEENHVEPRNLTPKRTGNISLNTNRNVSYEIKNGQPVFRLRRSPRKSLKNAYLEATHGKSASKLDKLPSKILQTPEKINDSSPMLSKRRSGSKLFTPSGGEDYLGFSPKRKDKRFSTSSIPSPVKFMVEETNANEDKENSTVLNIINQLDTNLESENSAAETPSQDNYAMYVTDDEAAKLAFETVQELAELDQQCFELTSDTDCIMEGIEPIEVSNDKEITKNVSENNCQPTDDLNQGATSNDQNSQKLFSIFSKPNTSVETKNKKELDQSKKPKAVTTQAGRDGLTQMIIDAGQKKIGAQHCSTCDFLFSDDPSEQKAHNIRHARALGHIDFKGWKKENKIDCPDLDGRVVMVRYRDGKAHWDKVESVVEIVDNILGIIPKDKNQSTNIRNPTQSMAFLFVSSAKQVVGFLLAEHISSKTDTISKSEAKGWKWKTSVETEEKSSERHFELEVHDLNKRLQSKICTGISRIWVRPDYQRKGIASRMVEAMRKDFLGSYHILSPDEFAFSHTTPNGTDFAINYMTKYFKRGNFLTYAPNFIQKEIGADC